MSTLFAYSLINFVIIKYIFDFICFFFSFLVFFFSFVSWVYINLKKPINPNVVSIIKSLFRLGHALYLLEKTMELENVIVVHSSSLENI